MVQTIAVTDAAVSVSGSTATIAHAALAKGTGYAVQIAAGAFKDADAVNYAGIASTNTTALNFATAANQLPVVTPSSGSTAASEQVAAAVDAGLTLADGDDATLASASVSITGNFRTGENVLAFSNTGAATFGNITSSYNASTGVLLLTSANATATVAQFQAALRAVTYTDTSNAPNTASRTIAFAASDATGSGATALRTITVAAVNDAPTASNLTQSLVMAEDAAATRLFTAAPTIADVDSTSVSTTLVLANPAAGSLMNAGAGSNGTYTITGTPAAVAAALATVNFVPAANYNGSTIVSVAISDGQNGPQGTNPSGTVSIIVAAVNDAPTAGNLTQTLAVGQSAGAVPLFTAAPTVADVDSASVSATLVLANPAAGSLVNAGGGSNGTYTITGTPAAVATALAAVSFVPSSTFSGGTTVSVAISDGQNGPQGTNPSGTVGITVFDNVPPTVTLGLAQDTGASGTDRNTRNPALTGTGEANGTVTIANGGTTLGSAPVNASGSWSFTPTLADGVYTLTAQQTDNAGNTGRATLGFTLDRTAPVVTQAAMAGTTLSGTGDPLGTITIMEGATTLGTAATDARGAWTFTPAVATGPHTFTASQTDVAGNTGSTSFAFVEDTVACYCRGTLIRTARGEVPVEELTIGDELVTISGALRPLRWIGHRAYRGRFLAGRRHLLPVLFRAGSLGEGLPRRDLFVSPQHAMFLRGVLVPAIALVDGKTIVQPIGTPEVEYFHLELDSHDVIWAEGAASESFVDDGGRGIFHNAAEYHALYPDAEPAPVLYCVPRVEDGPLLHAIRRELAEVNCQLERSCLVT